MWKKLAAAMVVTGAMALGSVGVAVAAPASGSGGGATSTPKAPGHPTCANAPKALARIEKVEAKITTRLGKLDTAEQRATQNNHPKLAKRIQTRIDRLDTLQSKAQTRANKIDARCPGVTPGSPGPSGSGGSSGSTPSAATSTGTSLT
jgi:hypothetical protein